MTFLVILKEVSGGLRASLRGLGHFEGGFWKISVKL